MYCNDRFVELESLGPLTRLDPGASIAHVEKWDILKEIDFLPEDIRAGLTT
jgi:hypothetical protein